LIEYAKENNKPVVKPVLLVSAKDTKHSAQLMALINSDDFRGGEFKGKVIEINTKLKGEIADESIEKLISLEHPDNIVEVVIHVNMLKEGWDVANVYTIAPLRASARDILTEQTIGRGLRLPYGERTGNLLVDRLMIVAHEQFARVVELAHDSTLIQGSEKISEKEIKEVKVITEVQPVVLQKISDGIKQDEGVMQELSEKAEAAIAKIPQIENIDTEVREKMVETRKEEMVKDLSKEVAQKQSIAVFHGHAVSATTEQSYPTDSLFGSFGTASQAVLNGIAVNVGSHLETRNIPIPRLILTPHYGELIIHDFDLDTSIGAFRTYTNERAILEEQLQNENDKNLFGNEVPGRRLSEVTRVTSFGTHNRQSPQSTIIAALLSSEFTLTDYDDEEQKPLLLKLSKQAVDQLNKKAVDADNLALIVESNAHTIAQDIYKQILAHKEYKSEGYLDSGIAEPKVALEGYRFAESYNEIPVTLESQRDRFSKEKIYTGFKKACHSKYKFDSSDEARMAYLLDKDTAVEDWLRPAPNQFEGLHWRDAQGDANHRYEPDFVVELADEIVMIEVKPADEVALPDVQAKKKTADEYCKVVNKNIGNFGIVKLWRYVIVPTENITVTSTVSNLLQ